MKKLFIIFSYMLLFCVGVIPLSHGAEQSRFSLQGRTDYHKAYGQDVFTDVERRGAGIGATAALSDRLSVSFGGSRFLYSFPDSESIPGFASELGAQYGNERMAAGGTYSSLVPDGLRYRDSYSIFYWIKVLDNLKAAVSYGRENRDNNYVNFASGLGEKYFTAAFSYEVNRRLVFSGDLKRGDLDDGNAYHKEGLEAKWKFVDTSAAGLYSSFRMERQMYDHPSSRYYAPSDQRTFSALLGFKRDVNVKKQTEGKADLHCELSIKAANDSNGELSVTPQASLAYDITPSVSGSVSVSQNLASDIQSRNYAFALTWKP